ncbi:MAG: metallophosphoesterase [Nitrospirae bacterium]|nr:metallophosphoesterase [Nitrospirota bacterium]
MRLLPVTLASLLASCTAAAQESPNLAAFESPPDQVLMIWAHSDIQPFTMSQRKQYELAAHDIRNNVRGVDFAIVAGDIAQNAEEDEYRWYDATKRMTGLSEWHEIAGNHDQRDNGELFRKWVNPELHGEFRKGNLLFLLMSDENKSSPTEIPDTVFEWWRHELEANRDKIIVTVTHAPLKESGLPYTSNRTRVIVDGKRFVDALRLHPVDLWISGHIHADNHHPDDLQISRDLNGTIFVDVSPIRADLFRSWKVQSRIIVFRCGLDRALIRSRNHSKQAFETDLDRIVPLSKPYLCE